MLSNRNSIQADEMTNGDLNFTEGQLQSDTQLIVLPLKERNSEIEAKVAELINKRIDNIESKMARNDTFGQDEVYKRFEEIESKINQIFRSIQSHK